MLLILFLLGYLAVGIFGKPDLIVAGILFGGSIFVLIMYQLLSSITQRILENEMEAGMNMHMAKPANADALYATLRQFISAVPRPGRED